MGTDKKAMEEALQAAVARMNRSETGAGSTPTDPLSVLAAVLPKLLENRGEREDIAEKIEGLKTEELALLREQVRLARLQLRALRKGQEEIIESLHQLREQQTALGDAVLHIARQMPRFELLDEHPDDRDVYDRVRPSAHANSVPRRGRNPPAKAPPRSRKKT